MIHIVSYSGGLNSFFAAQRVVEKFGKENTILVFCDTKTEDEDLYRFLGETTAHLDCEFITLSDGRNIWQVFEDEKFIGNSLVDPCSKILKRKLFTKWISDNYADDEAILYVGYDWTEAHRLESMQRNYAPRLVVAPLMEKPHFNRQETAEKLKAIGIKQPRLYDLGFSHNNCGGFCIKAGQAHFKNLYDKMPDRYKYHEENQERLFKTLGKSGFLKIIDNGKLRFFSLKEFREEILEKKSNQIDFLDIGGCGCFDEASK